MSAQTLTSNSRASLLNVVRVFGPVSALICSQPKYTMDIRRHVNAVVFIFTGYLWKDYSVISTYFKIACVNEFNLALIISQQCWLVAMTECHYDIIIAMLLCKQIPTNNCSLLIVKLPRHIRKKLLGPSFNHSNELAKSISPELRLKFLKQNFNENSS